MGCSSCGRKYTPAMQKAAQMAEAPSTHSSLPPQGNIQTNKVNITAKRPTGRGPGFPEKQGA